MWLFIQPQDTLFFRDGRPFNAGADVWTNTIFPPCPHTLYGMLRTLIAHGFSKDPDYDDLLGGISGDAESALLGTKDNAGALAIRGPFLGSKNGDKARMLLPSPADLSVLPKRNPGGRDDFYLMAPTQKMDISTFSDMGLPFLPLVFAGLEDGVKAAAMQPVSRSISNVSLLTYLKGSALDNQQTVRNGIALEQFTTEEICPIIARDESLRARDGHFAIPSHVRMQDGLEFQEKGLLLKITDGFTGSDDPIGLKFQDYMRAGPIIKLGGEGRVAKAEIVSHAFRFHEAIFTKIAETGRFRTVLTSPAYFPENGFFPDFLDEELSGLWELDGESRKVRLVSAAMNRPQAIGSWDMSAMRPRKTFKMVSAGTVFFFEITDYDPRKDGEWMQKFAERSFPGAIPGEEEFNKKGFNTFIIGAWDYVS